MASFEEGVDEEGTCASGGTVGVEEEEGVEGFGGVAASLLGRAEAGRELLRVAGGADAECTRPWVGMGEGAGSGVLRPLAARVNFASIPEKK